MDERLAWSGSRWPPDWALKDPDPKLWKHHASRTQADRINALAREQGASWLTRYGGRISAEWEFAKALQMLEEDPEIYRHADRWIEAADWIIWQLAGMETRNACTAGYTGIYQDGRYPSREFLAALHPFRPGLLPASPDQRQPVHAHRLDPDPDRRGSPGGWHPL